MNVVEHTAPPPFLKRLNTFSDIRGQRVHKEVLTFDQGGMNITPSPVRDFAHHVTDNMPSCSKFEQLPTYG